MPRFPVQAMLGAALAASLLLAACGGSSGGSSGGSLDAGALASRMDAVCASYGDKLLAVHGSIKPEDDAETHAYVTQLVAVDGQTVDALARLHAASAVKGEFATYIALRRQTHAMDLKTIPPATEQQETQEQLDIDDAEPAVAHRANALALKLGAKRCES